MCLWRLCSLWLTSPAVREGADWPRDWFLMRTKLLGSPGCCHAKWLTPLCMLLDRGRSCFPESQQNSREVHTHRPSFKAHCMPYQIVNPNPHASSRPYQNLPRPQKNIHPGKLKMWAPLSEKGVMLVLPVRPLAILLLRALLSSWLSCRCNLVFPAAGDRSGLLSFLNSSGGGAANSFWRDREKERKRLHEMDGITKRTKWAQSGKDKLRVDVQIGVEEGHRINGIEGGVRTHAQSCCVPHLGN